MGVPYEALVVDDEPDNREVARMMLQVAGFEVSVAADGIEALALAHSADHDFKIVLMDVFMPHMDGIEATRHLRAHPKTRNAVIIAVTGSEASAAGELGFDAVLPKPYKRQALLGSVERAMKDHGLVGTHEPIAERHRGHS